MDLEMGSDSGTCTNPFLQRSPSPSPSFPPPSPRTPALVVSNSGKLSYSSSNIGKMGTPMYGSGSSKSLAYSSSTNTWGFSSSGKSLSGKSLTSQSGKKKYVKQVTGKHNDTELHLAAKRGDVMAVKEILDEINEQMLRTMTGAEFDAEVAEIRASVVNEVNELGETALFTAAERGFLEVVKELLPYTTKEGLSLKNRSGFDPLHIASREGHQGNNRLNA